MPDDRKILLVSSIPPRTCAENDWEDLVKLTWATQKKYCTYHGYTFKHDISDVWTPTRSPLMHERDIQFPDSPIRYLIKFRLLYHYLSPERCGEKWDYVVWMDADCLVTNYEIPLTKFTNEFGADEPEPHNGDVVIPFDVNTLHPTVILARASKLTRGLFWAMSNIGETLFKQHEWNDHLAIKFFCTWPPYSILLHPWHSVQVLCAMHPGIYPIPEEVRADYEWTPESLTLHLSALDIGSRIALAQDYIERLKLL